jgi:dTDP-4-dehydrorhamnose 3,5-epimerase
MRIAELPIAGAYVVRAEPVHDERGYFARIWSREEFAGHHLVTALEQCSVAHNDERGTVRGMHYQVAPYGETKVVTCIAGSVYDVRAIPCSQRPRGPVGRSTGRGSLAPSADPHLRA